MAITIVQSQSHETSKLMTLMCRGFDTEGGRWLPTLARKDLCTTSGGTADGKDIIVELPRRIPMPNGIKVDAIVV